MLDDVGTDKIAAYAEHPAAPPTPNIDALARSGVLFRNAYGYPTCSPTRAALLTGRYGRRYGIGGIVGQDPAHFELPPGELLLPELLGSGWDTAALGKWHLSGWPTESGAAGAVRQGGFGYWAGSVTNLEGGGGPAEAASRGYFHWEKCTHRAGGRPECEMTQKYATVDTTDDALAQLGVLRSPWLLYVAYNAAHVPLAPPPADIAGGRTTDPSTPIALHDATIRALDHEIGRLLAALPPDVRARTTILLVSDNGTDRPFVLPPRDPDDAKVSLKEGGTNIPLIVAGPWVARPGTESAALVHVVDVVATIAEATGTPLPAVPLDGASFLRSLRDPAAPGARRYVYTERFSPIGPGPYALEQAAVRDDRWKLISTKQGDLLYDLQGRTDDGPPVDRPGGEAADARIRLRGELDRVRASIPYAW